MNTKVPVRLSSAQRIGLVVCGIFVAAGLAVVALVGTSHPRAGAAPVAALFPDTAMTSLTAPADSAAAQASGRRSARKSRGSRVKKSNSAKQTTPPRNFLDDEF